MSKMRNSLKKVRALQGTMKLLVTTDNLQLLKSPRVFKLLKKYYVKRSKYLDDSTDNTSHSFAKLLEEGNFEDKNFFEEILRMRVAVARIIKDGRKSRDLTNEFMKQLQKFYSRSNSTSNSTSTSTSTSATSTTTPPPNSSSEETEQQNFPLQLLKLWLIMCGIKPNPGPPSRRGRGSSPDPGSKNPQNIAEKQDPLPHTFEKFKNELKRKISAAEAQSKSAGRNFNNNDKGELQILLLLRLYNNNTEDVLKVLDKDREHPTTIKKKISNNKNKKNNNNNDNKKTTTIEEVQQFKEAHSLIKTIRDSSEVDSDISYKQKFNPLKHTHLFDQMDPKEYGKLQKRLRTFIDFKVSTISSAALRATVGLEDLLLLLFSNTASRQKLIETYKNNKNKKSKKNEGDATTEDGKENENENESESGDDESESGDDENESGDDESESGDDENESGDDESESGDDESESESDDETENNNNNNKSSSSSSKTSKNKPDKLYFESIVKEDENENEEEEENDEEEEENDEEEEENNNQDSSICLSCAFF